jgi:hypothetical protein
MNGSAPLPFAVAGVLHREGRLRDEMAPRVGGARRPAQDERLMMRAGQGARRWPTPCRGCLHGVRAARRGVKRQFRGSNALPCGRALTLRRARRG